MQVTWYGDQHRQGIVELVQSVAATGGAVGWLVVPTADEVDEWLASLAQDGVRLAVVTDAGRVWGSGYWRRLDGVVLRQMAEIRKVMTHPDGRGRGVAREVIKALVADATSAGVELLTLECRGNNHGAQRLYVGMGFQVTGRRPDAIAVGDERFDQVLMHLDLRSGRSGLTRHGSRREGPGVT